MSAIDPMELRGALARFDVFAHVENVGAEATMVQRYREEREHREFGFYLGTRDAGEIHHATGTESQ